MKLCHSSWASSFGLSIQGNRKKKGYLLAKQAEANLSQPPQQAASQSGNIIQLSARQPGTSPRRRSRAVQQHAPTLCLAWALSGACSRLAKGTCTGCGGKFSPELNKRGRPCKPRLVGAIRWLRHCVKAELLRPAFSHSLRHGLLLGSSLLIQL